jgi:chaperonin GroEL (HSP60 family)
MAHGGNMPDKSYSESKTDDKFQTLLNNANAARVISQVVESTIGPKGLDIMMVDGFGDVLVSNDGVTILKSMETQHPAGRMIINTARAQQNEVGDGTTTATIIAGTLVAEGVTQVLKGVPVTMVIEGIKLGTKKAVELIHQHTRKIASLEDGRLFDIACIAGRGHTDIAKLVVEGAKIIGEERLLDREYKFTDAIMARESSGNQVLKGIILNKEPVNKDMPLNLTEPRILVIDDALGPEDINHDAMKTESGFQYYLKARETYQQNLSKIVDLKVNLVVVDRGIDDIAEEVLTQAGVMVIHRASSKEIQKLCKHTGARKIKRATLNRDLDCIKSFLGRAQTVTVDQKLKYTLVIGGQAENNATVVVGASTEEVVDERERIAKDAASAVQAALQGGIVPGGGAIEVWIAAQLENYAQGVEGMVSFGISCVKEAILKPFICMVDNAGFNSLEKLRDVIAAQKNKGLDSIAVNFNNGLLINVMDQGIVDPALVKTKALEMASEVAVAILRINTIIKMRNERSDLDESDIMD